MWYLKAHDEENFIYRIVKNFLSDDEIEDLKRIVDTHTVVEQGTTLNNTNTNIRKSQVRWLNPQNTNFEYIYRKLTDSVTHVNNNYFKYNLSYIENLQYTIYKAEYKGHYDFHCDDHQHNTPLNDVRKLSFSCLLSDPVEYEGGIFEIQSGPTPIKVDELSKGDVIFFPSPLLHRVTEVTKGTRESLVGWVHGPNWV